MSKILILFAHPRLEKSNIHKKLIQFIPKSPNIFFHDLYETYPHFNIDVATEKELCESHDIIIWQHPLYWYSCPPILKQWIDMVLERDWAYGSKGHALDGKKVMSVISSGGGLSVYQKDAFNQYTIHEFMRPFERTATLCRMNYLPIYWIASTHIIQDNALTIYAENYRKLLEDLSEDRIHFSEFRKDDFFNTYFHENPLNGN